MSRGSTVLLKHPVSAAVAAQYYSEFAATDIHLWHFGCLKYPHQTNSGGAALSRLLHDPTRYAQIDKSRDFAIFEQDVGSPDVP